MAKAEMFEDLIVWQEARLLRKEGSLSKLISFLQRPSEPRARPNVKPDNLKPDNLITLTLP